MRCTVLSSCLELLDKLICMPSFLRMISWSDSGAITGAEVQLEAMQVLRTKRI